MDVTVRFIKPQPDQVEMEVCILDENEAPTFILPMNQQVAALLAVAIVKEVSAGTWLQGHIINAILETNHEQ